jgi:hypothetical protein
MLLNLFRKLKQRPGWGVQVNTATAREDMRTLGNLPLSRRPLLIHECDRVALCDAIKHLIIGKVLALQMAFEANNPNLNMTRFTTRCFADWADEFQNRVIFNHMGLLLPLHHKEMVKNERCTLFYPQRQCEESFLERLGVP